MYFQSLKIFTALRGQTWPLFVTNPEFSVGVRPIPPITYLLLYLPQRLVTHTFNGKISHWMVLPTSVCVNFDVFSQVRR